MNDDGGIELDAVGDLSLEELSAQSPAVSDSAAHEETVYDAKEAGTPEPVTTGVRFSEVFERWVTRNGTRFVSIRLKVGSAFAATLVVLLILGVFSIVRLTSLQSEVNRLANHDMLVVQGAHQLFEDMLSMENGMRGYLVTGNDTLLGDEYTPVKDRTSKDIQSLQNLVKTDPASRHLLATAIPNIQGWTKYADALIEMRNIGQGDAANVREASGEGSDKANAVHVSLEKLLQTNQQRASSTASALSTSVVVTRIIIIVLTLLVVLITVVLGVPATFNTPRNLENVTAILEDIASAGGDLRRRIRGVKSKDEVQRLADVTNELLETIGRLVANVVHTSHTVASSAEQLTASTDETARAVSAIAETAGEFAAISDHAMSALQDMNRSVDTVRIQGETMVSTVDEVVRAVDEVVTTTDRGNAFVDESRSVMTEVKENAHLIATRVQELESSSQQIAKITESIRAIADQTNLLSLNAAIEAARAGDAGRGFAVVAQEVRKLAEQSSQATKEIASIVRENQKLTQSVSDSMKTAVESIQKGAEATSRTSGAFQEIHDSVRLVVPRTSDILASVREQSNRLELTAEYISSVTQYIQQVAAGSEQNAASTQQSLATVEEIAASAHALARLGGELQELVSQFQV